MNTQSIVTRLQQHPGAQTKVVWERVAGVFKECGHVITKRTTAMVRAGIEYSNLSVVKEALASGEKDEIADVSWAEWIQRPYVFRHKSKGTEYVRLYPAVLKNTPKPNVQWFRDGKPVELSEIQHWLLAKERPRQDEESPLVFSVKASDVLSVGE